MKRLVLSLIVFGFLMGGFLSRASASSITFYSVFKDILYEQTSNVQPTSPSGYFVNGNLFSSTTDLLAGGSVDSTFPLTAASYPSSSLGWDAGFYPSLSAMNTAFPEGSTHTFSVNTNDEGTLMDSVTLPASSLFTANVPYLTNFSGLEGMNTAQPFTVTFPSTSPVGASNDSHIYFTIFSGISSLGLPNSATSFTIPAGTLLPNTTYTYELDYSNRLDTPATGGFSPGTGSAAYDVRTDGTFTTAAIPEPSSLTLFGIALASLGGYAWRSRKRARA
jgi:hypothetical protein